MKNARITIFFLSLLVVAFLGLAVRCFYLQYFKCDHYTELCLKQKRSLQNWRPQRGAILDCRGRVLAASNKIQIVKAEPRIIDEPKDVSNELAEIIDMPAHEICRLIVERKGTGYVRIKEDVDTEECDLVLGRSGIGGVKGKRIHPGVAVESDWRRYYPMGPLVANIIGFTDPYGCGLEGLELKYDNELSGSAVQNIFFADVRRRPIRLKEQNGTLADGVGIILTIDATIQQIVRDELVKQYEEFEAESAVAIVAEPKSGAILGMVSIPDYDPSDPQSADPNSRRNRAITDPFEPGSMIKPIVVAIAVDSGTIRKDEKIFCENGNYSGKGFGRVNEYRNHRFGNLSVREVLIKSSNIGMAKIGQKMGQEKLYDGLKRFGFGEKVGIELPGEVEGLLRPTSQWSSYSITRIPYGYEVNVTAMQMIQAYCILANGGHMVCPYMVKAIVDNNGEIIQIKRPVPPVGYIIKREVAEWLVQDCLVGVVNERSNGGTGWRAKLDKWQVFGKTGTANIARVGQRGYEENSNIASFVAGAPVEDPAIVVFVSIRRPNGRLGKGDSGGAVASPVAGRIIEKTLTYLESR
ncbi:MAG: penicillin-binding protein 2 [Sedimentisphaerales bacterium]|nr:penicillin-binding protein 2 [Sedimentisphaerales bacterium]